MLQYSYVDTRNNYRVPLAWLQKYRGDAEAGDHRLARESLDRVRVACDLPCLFYASSYQPSSSSISDPLPANLTQNTPASLGAPSDLQQPLFATTSISPAYPSPTRDEQRYTAEAATGDQGWTWMAFLGRIIASCGRGVAYVVEGIVRWIRRHL